MSIVERVIGHSVGAVLSSGAQNLDVLENIGLAVHVAERPLDAPADPHPSVHSLDHQDHLSVVTRYVQELSVAHFKRHVCARRHAQEQESTRYPAEDVPRRLTKI